MRERERIAVCRVAVKMTSKVNKVPRRHSTSIAVYLKLLDGEKLPPLIDSFFFSSLRPAASRVREKNKNRKRKRES